MAKRQSKQSRAELARLLSAVIKHPLLPVDLYNRMGDCLADMTSEIDHDTPEMIEKALAAYDARETKPKEGRRLAHK